jgi:hypothetical protein
MGENQGPIHRPGTGKAKWKARKIETTKIQPFEPSQTSFVRAWSPVDVEKGAKTGNLGTSS